MEKHEITASDLMPMEDYAEVRKERRRAMGVRALSALDDWLRRYGQAAA